MLVLRRNFILDGTTLTGGAFKPRRIVKGDVIGLLINRTEEGNSKTVSVFVNGVRHSLPQKIPETFDGTLFPHVQVKGAVVSINAEKKHLSKLPFECRMIADASKKDIAPTLVKEISETEIIVPLGFETAEWVESYQLENSTENFVIISQKFVNEWQEKSNLKRQNLGDDIMRSFFKLMGLRKRKFIYTLSNNLLSQDRKTFCERFPTCANKITVVPENSIEKLPANLAYYKDVTLPTEEEGWNHVLFTNVTEAKAKEDLAKWQKLCKNQTKVEDFKASDKLKEEITEWEKFVAATKKDAIKQKKEREIALKLANGETVEEEPKKEEEKKEEKKDEKEGETKEGEKKEEVKEVDPSSVCTIDFTEEDWMLARLRMELHTICQAFVEDVEDKERTSFSADFLAHYYKLYAPAGLSFFPTTFGCKTVPEIVELIKDTLKLESNMLLPVLDADASFDDFVQKTEDARQERVDRIGAGDEGAQLKFKAQRKGMNKGPKGNKGDFQNFNRGAQKGGKGIPQHMQQRQPQQQQRPATFNNNKNNNGPKGGAKGGFNAGKGTQQTYAMRTIPGAAAGMKRLQPSNIPQSAPKRIR